MTSRKKRNDVAGLKAQIARLKAEVERLRDQNDIACRVADEERAKRREAEADLAQICGPSEHIRIVLFSPFKTTRNLVAAAMRDAGFSVTCDALQVTLGGANHAGKVERQLGHTRTPVNIVTGGA